MGLFTQPDPIGLAGGLNQYAFAEADPVNGSDPLGLKVCFSGTRSEQEQQKKDFEQANRVVITSYDAGSGCATEAKANDASDSYAVDVAAMVSDPLFVARFAYGRLPGLARNEPGSGYDPRTRAFLIDRSDFGRNYGVAPDATGCLHVKGASYTREMVWLHESAHALASFNEKYQAAAFSDPVMDQEQALQIRTGKPVRPAACHAK